MQETMRTYIDNMTNFALSSINVLRFKVTWLLNNFVLFPFPDGITIKQKNLRQFCQDNLLMPDWSPSILHRCLICNIRVPEFLTTSQLSARWRRRIKTICIEEKNLEEFRWFRIKLFPRNRSLSGDKICIFSKFYVDLYRKICYDALRYSFSFLVISFIIFMTMFVRIKVVTWLCGQKNPAQDIQC